MAFRCSRCKTTILKYEQFCPRCGKMFGTPLRDPVICNNCGHGEKRARAEYCTRCGTRLIPAKKIL